MLIAIRVTRADTGDYLITLVLLGTINNPSHAIIHVAILINTIMRTAVKWGLVKVSSLLASFLLEIGSSQAAVRLLFEWTIHLSMLKHQMENAEQMFQNWI